MMRRTAVVAAALLMLTACSGSQTWKTVNITHVMPDLAFTLTNGQGHTVHASHYKGDVTLLYFGYTHCPDVCPLTLAHIGRVLKALGPLAKQVRVLFVSVDPKRDTPAVLKKYTAWYGPDFVGLTGTQDQLAKLAKRYRVSYSYGTPNKDGSYVVNHSSAIFVFDKQGHVRLLVKRSDATAAISHDLKQLIKSS